MGGNYMITKNDKMLPSAILEALEKGDKGELLKIKSAIQAFMFDEPREIFQKKIQAFGTQGDLATVAKDAYSVFMLRDNFDMYYEQVFQPVTIAPGQNSWEIHEVTQGLTVRKVKEGERLNVQKLTGTKDTAYAEKYGGALGWDDEMLRFNKIPAMQLMAQSFRNQFWKTKANVHYTLLLAAIVGNTTAWVAGANNLVRDIATLEAAIYNVANACKDRYPDTANARYVGFFHPGLRSRIDVALRTTELTVSNQASAGAKLLWNLVPVYSWFIPANTGVIVLPGNQLQRADVLDMQSMEDMDVLQLTYIQAIWAYYGAAIGDVNQVRGAAFV
jgi:hypothetical protein